MLAAVRQPTDLRRAARSGPRWQLDARADRARAPHPALCRRNERARDCIHLAGGPRRRHRSDDGRGRTRQAPPAGAGSRAAADRALRARRGRARDRDRAAPRLRARAHAGRAARCARRPLATRRGAARAARRGAARARSRRRRARALHAARRGVNVFLARLRSGWSGGAFAARQTRARGGRSGARVVAWLARARALRRSVPRSGPAQRARAQADVVRAVGCDRRRADDLPAGARRRHAQLGLSVLLATRRLVHGARAARARLPRRGRRVL